MKHPSREELMSYLYDELESAPRAALEDHLETCGDCRASLVEWQNTGRQLKAYRVVQTRAPQPAWQRWTRPALAAAAAAVVLFAGVAIGRTSGVSRAELEAVKRDAEAQALAIGRAETQRQLQQFAANMSQRLDALQAQQTRDYTSLRKELETVAVLTEASFRQTENRFVALADTAPTAPLTPSH